MTVEGVCIKDLKCCDLQCIFFKTEIAFIYQDCLFLEVITYFCTPGVIFSLLETKGLRDGKLVHVAVRGQWSWQWWCIAAGSKAYSVCSNSLALVCQACAVLYIYILLSFSICFFHFSWTLLTYVRRKKNSSLLPLEAEGKTL